MDDILKEILRELKEMRKELNEENDISVVLKIGDEIFLDKVISKINKQNRVNGKTTISV